MHRNISIIATPLRMSKFLSLTSVSVLLLVMHVFPWIAILFAFLLVCSFYTIISLLLYMPWLLFSVLLPVMHMFQWIVISQKKKWFLYFYSFAVFIQYFAFSKCRLLVQHKRKNNNYILTDVPFFYNILYFSLCQNIWFYVFLLSCFFFTFFYYI